MAGFLFENWDDYKAQWVYSTRVVYTYTSSGCMRTGFVETWNEYEGYWVNSCRFEYQYDERDNLVHGINEAWIYSTWQLDEGTIVFYHNGYFYYIRGTEVFIFYNTTTDLDESSRKQPSTFDLKQNYPNPFNPSTTIEYKLPTSTTVQLTIYNLLGQKVRTLVNARQTAGLHQVVWDGKDTHGQVVNAGVYLYQLQCGPFSLYRKMIFLK